MIEDFPPVFLTMFILIDPLGVAMVYLGLMSSHGLNAKECKNVALKAPFIAFIVLMIFTVLGRQLITSLAILPGSLYIAGGILLFFISMDLLFAKPKRTTRIESSDEQRDSSELAVFPLAMPMLSGPGAITAILLFTSEHPGNWHYSLMLCLVLMAVLLMAVAFMLLSPIIQKIIGKTGVSVIERVLGILLSGMSVQFVVNGLEKLDIINSLLPPELG